MKKNIKHVIAHLPWVFSLTFAALVFRAACAFGDLPKLSGNDPWALVNRAPLDTIHDFFSYSAHISLTYWLIIPAILGALLTIYMLIKERKWNGWIKLSEISGCTLTAALLVFESGRFLWWFLD
jgi:hypothetical protein